jgi:hypothetical protein
VLSIFWQILTCNESELQFIYCKKNQVVIIFTALACCGRRREHGETRSGMHGQLCTFFPHRGVVGLDASAVGNSKPWRREASARAHAKATNQSVRDHITVHAKDAGTHTGLGARLPGGGRTEESTDGRRRSRPAGIPGGTHDLTGFTAAPAPPTLPLLVLFQCWRAVLPHGNRTEFGIQKRTPLLFQHPSAICCSQVLPRS